MVTITIENKDGSKDIVFNTGVSNTITLPPVSNAKKINVVNANKELITIITPLYDLQQLNNPSNLFK